MGLDIKQIEDIIYHPIPELIDYSEEDRKALKDFMYSYMGDEVYVVRNKNSQHKTITKASSPTEAVWSVLHTYSNSDVKSVDILAENIYDLIYFIWDIKYRIDKLDAHNIEDTNKELDSLYSDICDVLHETKSKPTKGRKKYR